MASQRQQLRRRSWAVAHRPLGRRGDRLRVVKPSSARQPASAIRTRATSILESWFSVASSRTVASSLRMRSAIVSSLNPRVSKAFTQRPCGTIARTSSTWRSLADNLCFLGSVAFRLPPRSRRSPTARCGEAIAESFASDCHVANAGNSYPLEIWKAAPTSAMPSGSIHGDLGQSGACR